MERCVNAGFCFVKQHIGELFGSTVSQSMALNVSILMRKAR